MKKNLNRKRRNNITIFPKNKVLSSNKSYDEIAKMVNDKLKENELNLPSGTSFEISGYADYFESIYEDGDDYCLI